MPSDGYYSLTLKVRSKEERKAEEDLKDANGGEMHVGLPKRR